MLRHGSQCAGAAHGAEGCKRVKRWRARTSGEKAAEPSSGSGGWARQCWPGQSLHGDASIRHREETRRWRTESFPKKWDDDDWDEEDDGEWEAVAAMGVMLMLGLFTLVLLLRGLGFGRSLAQAR